MQNSNIKKAKLLLEVKFYLQTIVFAGLTLALFYLYLLWQDKPAILNKAVANTGILLIGLSMFLGSAAYFFHTLKIKVIYRKYLGLVGFPFALWHFLTLLPQIPDRQVAWGWRSP